MSGPKQDTPTPVNREEHGQPDSCSNEASDVGAAVRKQEANTAAEEPSHTWSIMTQASAGSVRIDGRKPREKDGESEGAGQGDDMSQDEVLTGVGAWA